MESFYKFASENPVLTFFIILLFTNCIVSVAGALRGKK